MAYQGLFTQGTSVDDLLEKRRVRSQDLQQQLMQQAAQGARNPVRAQGASMLGSILGRSLAGAMGGQDTEMEKLKEREASTAGIVKQYATAASGTDPQAMYAAAKTMMNTGDPQAINMANGLLQRAGQLAAQQKEDLLEDRSKAQLLINAKETASALPVNHPLKKTLLNPNVTTQDLTAGRKAVVSIYDEEVATGKLNTKKALETTVLKRNSKSLALVLGADNHPEVVASLNNNPTEEVYKKAVTLLDKAEKVEKSSDIISNYFAESGGVSGRYGTRRDGTIVKLTSQGAMSFQGQLSNVTSKQMVVDSPLVTARKSYEYVNDNAQYKKISTAHTLGTRTDGLFEEARLGNSKSVAALYRTVSEMYNGDSKAASEIEALRKAGTITDTLFNSIKAGTQGGLTDQTLDQLQAVVDIGKQAINTTLGELVSKEYRSRVGGFEDTSILSNQLLSFFDQEQIMDVEGPLDPQRFPEGATFKGTAEHQGKTFMVVAGNIIQL